MLMDVTPLRRDAGIKEALKASSGEPSGEMVLTKMEFSVGTYRTAKWRIQMPVDKFEGTLFNVANINFRMISMPK